MKLFQRLADFIIKMMLTLRIFEFIFSLTQILLVLKGIRQSDRIAWGFITS